MNVRFYLSHDIKITLKSHLWCEKPQHFVILCNVIMDQFQNLKTASGLLILLHDVISLPEATLCDKDTF